ncbi:MAG: hypothetical protein HYY36_05790 [Gammaproteobacteria bacterium]|nr:hypothetical protein [Gammaproteobacteria bacterium]
MAANGSTVHDAAKILDVFAGGLAGNPVMGVKRKKFLGTAGPKAARRPTAGKKGNRE